LVALVRVRSVKAAVVYFGFLTVLAVACLLLLDWKAALGITLRWASRSAPCFSM
jgi:hypothetical protein